MALKRIIPCLLYNGTGLVKTVNFKDPKYIGDPINAIKIFNDKEVDELILLDINATKENRQPNFEQIADFAGEAFMPFAYGGGVKTLEHFSQLYKIGVEKVIVNTLLIENPEIVMRAVERFGSQAVVASIDVKKSMFGGLLPYSYSGQKLPKKLSEYLNLVTEKLGVGEVMLTNVDLEGTWKGYDFDVLKTTVIAINTPLIANGGCGSEDDLRKVLYDYQCNAAAVGSMAVYSKKGMGVLINFPDRNNVILEE